MSDFAPASARTRHTSLALVIVVHFLALLYWQARPLLVPRSAASKSSQMVFIQASKPQRQEVAPAKSVAPPRPRVAMPAQLPAQLPAPMVLIPSSAYPALVPEVPAIDAESIAAQAKRDLGQIDKELRKNSLDIAVREWKPSRPKLEVAIEAAFKKRGPQRVEEIILADGRRMSKIGNICIRKGENDGLSHARDAFRGIPNVATSCPR